MRHLTHITDIHVDAVVAGAQPGTFARLYAIVEAKGNWHQELFENMKTQLRDRYLNQNRCRSGIYLVGWFSSTKWKSSDSRQKRITGVTVEDAKRRLSQQAAELSTGGFDIRSYVLSVSLT
jgi:hypothetical protein